MTDMEKMIAEEIERIRTDHDGELRPEDVVEEASDKSHPLHDLFEWDDSVAAHKYRLDQARTLIRSIPFTIHETVMPFRVPFYVSDPLQQQSIYVPTTVAQRDEAMAAALIEKELHRCEAAMDRTLGLAITVGQSRDALMRLQAKVNALAQTTNATAAKAARAQARQKAKKAPGRKRGENRPSA